MRLSEGLSSAGMPRRRALRRFRLGPRAASDLTLVDRALVLDPNLAAAWDDSGAIRNWLSEPEVGISHIARSMRLSRLIR
jgi:hypothetical protein